MNAVGFVGTGHYVAALAEGMFGLGRDTAPTMTNTSVILHDIDKGHADDLAARLRSPCTVVSSARAVFRCAEISFLGVPVDQLPGILDDLATVRKNASFNASVLLMDGVRAESVRASYPDMPVGMIMYNYPVIYRCGMSGFWPGTLGPQAIALTKDCLSLVGDVWTVDDPNMIHLVRATVGCGFGILAAIAADTEKAMRACGLPQEISHLAVTSIIRGLAAHLINGGTCQEASLLAPSTNSGVMAELLRETPLSGMKDILNDAFCRAMTRYRERA